MCMQDGGMQVAELIDNPLCYNFALPDGYGTINSKSYHKSRKYYKFWKLKKIP